MRYYPSSKSKRCTVFLYRRGDIEIHINVRAINFHENGIFVIEKGRREYFQTHCQRRISDYYNIISKYQHNNEHTRENKLQIPLNI